MPRFIIERNLPGAGDLSPKQLREISEKSVSVLNEMGPKIQWEHSYVAGDKIYCVYIAPDEKVVLDHAQRGGFPANVITPVSSIIDPTTGGA